MKHVGWAVVVALVGMTAAGLASAPPPQPAASGPSVQTDLGGRLDQLTARIERIEGRVARRTSGAVLLLFGAFCALWAQYSKRNPWLWFFFGLVFSILALPIVLMKNADAVKGIAPSRRRSMAQAVVFGLLLAIVVAGLWLDSRL
jgi:hypothetical protein